MKYIVITGIFKSQAYFHKRKKNVEIHIKVSI